MFRTGSPLCLFARSASEGSAPFHQRFTVIAIVDYGAGNLQSVQNAFDAVGAGYVIVRDAAGLQKSTRIVLPGVGNFGHMMRRLDELNLRDQLRERLVAGVPFLGICLGLQALFKGSAEAPDSDGLGILPGRVERFSAQGRVPHMGWNNVTLTGPSRLLPAPLPDPFFYFAHSYFAPAIEGTTATCEYENRFAAAIERKNISGVQFHPEKSGPAGLALIRRFLEF
jgi:imidazole glycerol-phosphate synthase subunit HisH